MWAPNRPSALFVPAVTCIGIRSGLWENLFVTLLDFVFNPKQPICKTFLGFVRCQNRLKHFFWP